MHHSLQTADAIVISELSVVYHASGRSRCAIEKLSVSIPKEELLCVVGPSGGGKTTLLLAIAGLLDNREIKEILGTVSIDGDAPLQARRSHNIGFVFQSPSLLP